MKNIFSFIIGLIVEVAITYVCCLVFIVGWDLMFSLSTNELYLILAIKLTVLVYGVVLMISNLVRIMKIL